MLGYERKSGFDWPITVGRADLHEGLPWSGRGDWNFSNHQGARKGSTTSAFIVFRMAIVATLLIDLLRLPLFGDCLLCLADFVRVAEVVVLDWREIRVELVD